MFYVVNIMHALCFQFYISRNRETKRNRHDNNLTMKEMSVNLLRIRSPDRRKEKEI